MSKLTPQRSEAHVSQRNGPSPVMNKGFESRNSPQSLGIFAQGTVTHKAAEVEGKTGPIRKRWAFTQTSTCFSILWVSFTALRVLCLSLSTFLSPSLPVTTWLPSVFCLWVCWTALLCPRKFFPQRDIISQREEQSYDMWKRWYIQKEYWQITPSCPKGKHYIREGWVPVCKNWINQISNV